MEKQNEVLNAIIKDSLTVDQTEKKVKTYTQEKKVKPITKGYSRNVQIAINTIKQAVAMVERTGIKIDVNLEEKEDSVCMKLNIKK